MQLSNLDYQHLLISGVISGLIWLSLYFYRNKGRTQLRFIARGELSEPVGLGAWYARNITRIRFSIVYSLLQYSLVPILFWIILSFLNPVDFPIFLSSTWSYFIVFILIGIGDGLDLGYRWWGLVEEDDEENVDDNLESEQSKSE